MSTATERALAHIHTILDERDLSINALSKLMGVSQSTLNRALRGDVEITFAMLYDVCKALDVSIVELIEQVEVKAKKKKRV